MRDYDIADRIKRYNEDADEDGDRNCPPRTSVGTEGLVAKDHPYLFASRTFLFGLVSVPRWLYDWGYSNAYIELLLTDTALHRSKTAKSVGGETAKASDAEEAIRIFNERRKNREGFTPISLAGKNNK